jgi:hypothetical protein
LGNKSNTASRNGVPLAVTILALAVIWLCLSVITVDMEMFKSVSPQGWMFLGIAGSFFFVANFWQFQAMLRAPLTGYVIILVATINVLITTGFDVVRQLRTGAFTPHDIRNRRCHLRLCRHRMLWDLCAEIAHYSINDLSGGRFFIS